MDSLSLIVYDLIEYLNGIPPYLLYIFFGFSTMIENIFPPWPSDTLIVFSGFLASEGNLSAAGVFSASLAGNTAGGIIMYYFGSRIFQSTRKLQKKIHASDGFYKKIFRFASHESLVKSRNLFEKYGAKFVLFSRFFPGVRFFVSIVAGVHSMNFTLYVISFSAGSFLWGAILVGAGYFMGNQWENVLRWIKIYNTAVIVLLILAMILYGVYALKKNKKTSGVE
ncbi:MAG: DedA family protein [Spirochaetia bacterium]|nr:DedA family protein [Spirochaetia bacterium]